jgi:uncharacterized GH25 family protein
MIRRAVLTLVVTIASHASALAHDFWLYPTTFNPEPGAVVGVRLRVGEHLMGDPVPRSTALIDEFVVVDDAGRKPLVGREGSDPAGFVRADAPGLLVIGYRSKPRALVLPGETFNRYLAEEGLDAVAALRGSRSQTSATASEIFYRCAKTLVVAGEPTNVGADRRLGFTFELMAEGNPQAFASGDEITFRVLYENRPVARVLIVALNRDGRLAHLTARSDDTGRVRFRLNQGGMWLVKAVHMVPAREGAGAEWASYWASLTFNLRHGAATASSTSTLTLQP